MSASYATIADMISHYGEVEMRRVSVVDGEVPETVLPTRIERALRDASSLADTYLGSRIPVPVAVPPEALLLNVRAIARYYLWTGGDRTPSDDIKAAYAQALAWLKAVAEGLATIDGTPPAGAPTSCARTSDRPRLINMDSTRGLG